VDDASEKCTHIEQHAHWEQAEYPLYKGTNQMKVLPKKGIANSCVLARVNVLE